MATFRCRALQLVILMNTHEQVPLLPIGYTMPNIQVIDAFFYSQL